MNSANKNVNLRMRIDFLGLLSVLFIGLKLCGVIDWSWWWVLSPIWIPFLIVLIVLTIFYLILKK